LGVKHMQSNKYEFVIVGSGAGGATLARELSKRGKHVLVVERGRNEEKVGSYQESLGYLDILFSKEGVCVYRGIMAGGTTVICTANGVRCLEEELSDFGITLEAEFAEAEKEMGISLIDQGLISEGSERIMWASQELGYKMEPMPKFIDPGKCRKCGRCVWGCVRGAKWTALDYLQEASQAGAELAYETSIEQVVVENGKVKGVRGTGPNGPVEILSDVVILAAGGLETPVILQKSGVKDAGSGFFVDLFINTYGVTEGLNQLGGPQMALVDHEFHKSRGFMISPSLPAHKMSYFWEIGAEIPSLRGLIGIMTKIKDEPVGHVYPDGSISKSVTEQDWARLNEGSSIGKEILVKAGADEKSIVVSRPGGAHPGGAAAIGKVLDKDMQTDVDSLFVCDASALPAAAGMPPILIIVALAKRLAKTLA
jgi:choline dehydrogenase-like flavoprotein